MITNKDDLPAIEIKETFQAIKTLASASAFLRDFLVNVLSKEDVMKIDGITKLLIENNDSLRLADAVVNKWLDEFEEDELDFRFSNN